MVPISVGMVPVSLVRYNSKWLLILVSIPSSVGIVPISEFRSRYNSTTCSFVELHITPYQFAVHGSSVIQFAFDCHPAPFVLL